jgi:hypothetical protein
MGICSYNNKVVNLLDSIIIESKNNIINPPDLNIIISPPDLNIIIISI